VVADIYVSIQAVALLRLAYLRFPYPKFLFSLFCWFAQSLNVALGPQYGADQDVINVWIRHSWIPGEAICILATALACIEAINRGRQFVPSPFHRMQLGASGWSLAGCLTGLGIVFVAPVVGDGIESFRLFRSWGWVALALAMAIVAGLLALQRVRMPRMVRWHLYLLTVVMWAHAGLSWFVNAEDTNRAMARMAYRLTVIACCVGWLFIKRQEKAL
jgi:hypothetical protein